MVGVGAVASFCYQSEEMYISRSPECNFIFFHFTVEAVSWDIKLERESEQGVCEDEVPLTLGKHVYHHRQALRYFK